MASSGEKLDSEIKSDKVKLSIPQWGKALENDNELVESHDIDELELLKSDTSEKTSATVQSTAEVLKKLRDISEENIESDLNFLYDDESEDVLEEIMEESKKYERDLDAIIGSSRVKATGMTLEIIDELKRAAPETFKTRHIINTIDSNLLNVNNENDIMNLMIVMTRYKGNTETQPPAYIEEERRRMEVLEGEKKKRQEFLEQQEKERLARVKALELEQAQIKEQQRLKEKQDGLIEEEGEGQLLIEQEVLEEQLTVEPLPTEQGSLVEIPNIKLYEDNLEPIETEMEEFSQDESSTYSLKDLEKKQVIPEDTIL